MKLKKDGKMGKYKREMNQRKRERERERVKKNMIMMRWLCKAEKWLNGKHKLLDKVSGRGSESDRKERQGGDLRRGD
jgi:FtsZ-interacting cell division protein ZipA